VSAHVVQDVSGGSLRARRAQLVRRLYDESPLPPHKRKAEITRRTGFSKRYVHELFADPAGERVAMRRRKYFGSCKDCGARTNSGGTKAPDRCADCAKAHREAHARWTPEAIVQAVRDWAWQHDGRPPRVEEWHNTGPDHPSSSTVILRMGWANALAAAGFKPRWQGRGRVVRLTADVLDETVAVYQQHGTLTGAARVLGLSTAAVRRRLLKAGVKPRSVRRSGMPKVRPEDMAERQVSSLRVRKEQLEAEISALEQDIAKWEAVKTAMESMNGVAA
jgi:hypothetical protein